MDEMNCHIPQSLQTRVELEEIAAVPTQIISPAKSTPIISVVQDSMIGSYLLTQDSLAITGEQLFHYLMPVIQLKSNFNYMEARKKRFWTGKELFSVILPNVSLENGKISIHNGEIVDGFMDKKTLGGGANGIIQAIFNQFGSRVCRDFLDNLQRLVVAWMEETGFTIGFGDAIPSRETRDNIQEVLQNKMLKANELIRKSQLGMFKPELSESLRMAALEIDILNIANEATMEVEEIVQDNLPADNHFIQSVKSGSKGNSTNLNQIMGTVGQQMVDGKRVNFGWNGRTLAHFTKWDQSLASRGFVYSSYMSGMRPHEFFYAAMGSRVGSINSHIRTAETGYIQRRLIKAMEDLRVAYDDTVRDASNNIVQYTYGLDGFDPVKLEHVPLILMPMDNNDLSKEYQWSFDNVSENVLTSEAYTTMQKQKAEQTKAMEEEWEQIQEDRRRLRYELFPNQKSMERSVLSPVNFKRMLQEITDQFHIEKGDISDITPKEIIEGVRELTEFVVKYTPNKKSYPILKIMIRSHLSSKQCLLKYRMPRSVFRHAIQMIRHKIMYAYVNPGEMVGIVAAQSIGEPVTQLTLNSIDYTDKITVNGTECFSGQIGDFIEREIEEAEKSRTQYLENDTTYVDVSQKDYEVVCVDENGKTHWKKLEAVTKHLPGKDGVLLKVRTKAGRVVHATKAKSFLARRDNLIVGVTGEELKVGDYLPVTIQFPECKNVRKEIDLSHYLPRTEFLYGSELYKAKKIRDISVSNGERHWFSKAQGVDFVVPYKRSDSCMDALKRKQVIEKGVIYPKKCNRTTSKIPESMTLDEEFGFFVGAYLAEGGVTKTYVHISNNDEKYQTRLKQFLDRYSVGYHTDVSTNKRFKGSKSTDLKIHSVLLATLMERMCGNGSANKFVPPFAFTANKEFVRGVLDGYFSGDGTVNLKEKAVYATSVSETLLDGVLDLLAVFGVFGRKYGPTIVKKNNVGSKNILPHWSICMRNRFAQRFIRSIRLTDNSKQEKLEKICSHQYARNSFCNDIIPSVVTSQLDGDYRRDELRQMLKEDLSEEDRLIIEEAVNSEVYFDKVISIDEVKSTKSHVFDLTVADTRNFCLLGGLHVRDTFHFAGVGAKAMITNSGVPRAQEIINMSKDIKTPSMVIYMKPEYAENRDAAIEVKNALEYTEIQDILAHSEIMYVPNVKGGKYEEEERAYEVFEEMLELMEMECDDPDSLSNWVLWMEFDREAMLQRGIYMQDVYDEIVKNCNVDTDIQCVVPDMNSSNLTMRIRVHQDFDEGEDYIAFFRSLGDCLLTLPLRGVPGIKKVVLDKESQVHYKEDGTPEIVKEWILRTTGSNMVEVLSNDYVDTVRTTTNDISEIHNLFGIEGARYAIIREIEATIANGGASEIDYRHFSVLADLMTYRGIVMQIQRHGFGKSPYISPLGRATYEVMDKVLISAGIFAEKDNMNGTSANIIAGQAVKTGTNAFDVLLNQDLLPDPVEARSSETLLPPEPKVSEMAELTHSPAMAPLEDTEAFEFDEDFNLESKDIRLEDYMRDIGTRPVQVDDSDFTFGYDIEGFEEHALPAVKFQQDVQLNIVKSSQRNVTRRRRKK